MDLFYKTMASRWNEVERFEDVSPAPNVEFNRLVNSADDYQIIVIDTFSKLGGSVNELMACFKKTKLPIYSLQEGLLYLDEKERTIQGDSVQPCFDCT